MNFLGKLENSLKPKEEKKKKLYGEADIDGFDASIFNLPEDMQTDVAEVQAETATNNLDDIPEEPEETNYDDLPEPEYEEPDYETADNEFTMDEETDADAGYSEEGSEDENMLMGKMRIHQSLEERQESLISHLLFYMTNIKI